MPNLRFEIERLAVQFTSSVLACLRQASLHEVLALGAMGHVPKPRASAASEAAASKPTARSARKFTRSGRLKRRTPAELAADLARVVAHVSSAKNGASSEEIQRATGLAVKEMPQLLRMGMLAKSLSRKGQRRATRYFAR